MRIARFIPKKTRSAG